MTTKKRGKILFCKAKERRDTGIIALITVLEQKKQHTNVLCSCELPFLQLSKLVIFTLYVSFKFFRPRFVLWQSLRFCLKHLFQVLFPLKMRKTNSYSHSQSKLNCTNVKSNNFDTVFRWLEASSPRYGYFPLSYAQTGRACYSSWASRPTWEYRVL